jgi:oligopeptide transport system permease protein
MGRYVIRRLLQIIPVFFGATFLIYALVFALPGDPIAALGGDRALPESTISILRERYNLNDPLIVQYGKYIVGLFQGEFGESFRGRQVADIVAQSFPVTLRLSLFAFAFELVFGLLAGVMAGLRKGSFIDNLVLVTTTAVVSIPVFVLGYVAQLVLGVQFRLLPISGLSDGWQSYILPAFVLAALSLAYVARLTRTSLVENLRSDYVRTATAKGLPRSRVVGRHTLRNSLIPVVTFLGIDLGNLMQGAIVTEGIFNLPGLGGAVYQAVRQQEGTVVVGIVTIFIVVFIFANLLVDLLYAVLDPRIRYE